MKLLNAITALGQPSSAGFKPRRVQRNTLCTALVITLLGMFSAHANVKIFMRLTQGINYTGDSLYKGFPSADGWFEIQSMEFGVENNINIGSVTSGGGAGKAIFKELSISKTSNSATTALFNACVTGQHWTGAEIIFVRSGDAAADIAPKDAFLKLQMKLVMVQDISTSVSDGDYQTDETVILQYGAHQINFFAPDTNGTLKPAGESIWSRVLNTASFEV